MGRIVDPEKMDDDDKRWLSDRPWLVEEFRRQGFNDQMDSLKEGQTERPSPEDETRIGTDDMRVGTQAPQIAKPRGNGVIPVDDDEEVDDNYEEWTADELRAEIDVRNEEEDRETKLSKSGNKTELAARLHADDSEQVSA